MKNSTRTAASVATALVAGAALALTPALAASAHVSASASSTAAGSRTVVTFSVPHGCDGSPTIALEIEIPDTIRSVTPTVNPNWTISKTMVPLDDAEQDSHGESVTERVGSVTYTALGAGLAEGYRDTVELSLQLPDGEAGDVVAFPTVQRCAEGIAEWTGDDAPAIVLTAATADDDHGHGHGHAHDDDSVTPDAAGERVAPNDETDVLARVLGIAGLAFGVVGVVLAILAGRSRAGEKS